MTHVAVVGASLAGFRVAEGLRAEGFDGDITLIGDEPHLPYDRPPLSKSVLVDDEPASTAFQDAVWFADNRVTLHLGETARRLDTAARTVHTDARSLNYDELVVATGATPRNPFPDAPDGVFTLRTADDGARIRTALRAAQRLVVIGAGFIGLEIASSARRLGVDVTVVELEPVPLTRSVGDDAAAVLADIARADGVHLLCGRAVAELRGTTTVESVVLDDGTELPCDAVVVGVGAVPATGWLAGSGLEVTRAGLICDATGRAGDHVWGVGDVCAWTDDAGTPHRHEHWTSAAEQAKVVAHNLACDDKRTVTAATYVWSDQFGRRIDIVGDITGHDDLRVLSRNPDDLAYLYARDGLLTGACLIGQPRLMVRCRQWIAARTPVADLELWVSSAP